MNIDLQQPMHNQEFQPLMFPNKSTPVTLGYIAIQSLLADEQTKQVPDARLKRYDLAERINNAGNVIDLAEQDIALLLSCVTQWQPTCIFAQVFRILSAL